MTDNAVRMQYSENGQDDWSNWDEVALGEVGEYGKKLTWDQLGQHTAMVVTFSCSSPRRRDVIAVVGAISRTIR